MAGKAAATAAMTVKDIMTSDPVCVGAGTTARELARVLESNEISGVPVVDNFGRVTGVVSKTDLLHRCVEGPLGSRPGTFFEHLADGLDADADFDPENLGTVEDFMSTDPVTARPDESLVAAARRMAENGVHRIIVVNDRNHVIGIVTSLDLLKRFPG